VRVARDFLRVAGFERLDLKVREERFDFSVSELATLDAGGRADALDGRYAAQRRQALRRKRTKGAPRAFELIDFCDEAEDFVRPGRSGCRPAGVRRPRTRA
jgi:hypothetical protein